MNPNEQAVGYIADIGNMELDLTKEEKLRTAALIMAIHYHVETIVKDAAMYQAMVNRQEHLKPSTVERVVRIAEEFERFLLGKPSVVEPIGFQDDGQAQAAE